MYHVGMACGILVGALVGLLLVRLMFKYKLLDKTFDERQELARGKAFKCAFFTLLVSLYVYAIVDDCVGRWCDTLVGVTICMAVSLLVFAVICINKDAYLSLRERPRQVMVLFALLGIFNLGLGGIYLSQGELIEEGILTLRAVNPIVGAMSLVILVVYMINFALREKEAE